MILDRRALSHAPRREDPDSYSYHPAFSQVGWCKSADRESWPFKRFLWVGLIDTCTWTFRFFHFVKPSYSRHFAWTKLGSVQFHHEFLQDNAVVQLMQEVCHSQLYDRKMECCMNKCITTFTKVASRTLHYAQYQGYVAIFKSRPSLCSIICIASIYRSTGR
jgi:hypothetical protein